MLLLAAQFALPRLAEDEVRERLGGDEVTHVEVEALPAIELLWRRADRVSARVGSFDARGSDLADELVQTRAVDRLDVRIARARVAAALELHDLHVEKRDGLLRGTALLDPRELSAALPPGVDGTVVPRADGRVVVDARIAGAPLRLRVRVEDGRVVARPEGLLGAVTSYTLFGDPRVEVESIAVEPAADGRLRVSATARIR